jgi:hypothetical protein
MPWLSNASPKRPHNPAPVPDVHVLRRKALEASWRRDRWVGHRRVAVRWTLFYARRYGLPGLLLLCIGLVIWLRVMPWAMAPDDEIGNISAALPVTSTLPKHPTPATFEVTPAAPLPANPESDPPLRLERYWRGASARQIYVHPDDTPAPQLKPDHWLHSQEP